MTHQFHGIESAGSECLSKAVEYSVMALTGETINAHAEIYANLPSGFHDVVTISKI